MAGGPQPAVDGLITGLNWIFGTQSSTADEENEVMSQLGKALDEVEEAFFGEDMQPVDEPEEEEPEEFDLAMNALYRHEEDIEPPVFGPNMEVL